MQDRPDPGALLDMVAAAIRETILPELDGTAAYQARIAANLVGLVRRQWDAAMADDEAETARLQALLSHGSADLRALNLEFAARLRDGELAFDDPAVADHLWATTLAKLAVDQPTYPRFQKSLDRSHAHDTLAPEGEADGVV